MRQTLYIICLVLGSIISGCGGPGGGDAVPVSAAQVAERIDARISTADSALDNLSNDLDKGLVRNALLLKEYARISIEQNPALASLVTNLAKDASAEGAQFQNLRNRLTQVKNKPDFFESPVARYQEVNAIISAAKPENFNFALIDVVNVLADMSGGTLPRIEVPPKAESLATNQAQDLGAGSQLIGNPSYGQWTDQGGTSVWAWYGMYAMFRDLTGGRSYSFNQWDRNRDWSYHSDIGRNKHGQYQTGKNTAPTSKKHASGRDYGVSRKSYGSNSAERRSSTFSKGAAKNTSAVNKSSSKMPGSFRNRSTYSRGMGGK